MPSEPEASAPALHAIRAATVTFAGNPFETPGEALRTEEDALIVMRGGHITAHGPYSALAPALPPGTEITHYPGCVVSAGFIDAHVHYPQLAVTASWGHALLPWLEDYVFPEEAKFADPAYAGATARAFLTELLRNGTTTACVYCTVHEQSVRAFFTESARIGARMIAGKVLMDRNCPDSLREDLRAGHEATRSLIRDWHGKGRALYAVTPRFAITSSPEQLESAGDLFRSAPGLFMQTHLAENPDEIAAVRALFPDRASYLDVYARAGLDGKGAVFGHAIHLHEADFHHCHHSGCALAHCPTSNLFLGSDAFRLFEAVDPRRPVHVALGSDVGAGTTLSMLATMGEAYKVALMAGLKRLTPEQALWLATAGAAKALGLEDRIGHIAPGMEADLCVLDPAATPMLAQRTVRAQGVADLLFPLMILGDDRCVRATWISGKPVHERAAS